MFAVLWKITPRLAEWITSPSNPLWTQIPPSTSTVVELGCGISGLLALSLGPWVGHYIATDQEYVYRLLRENLEANRDLAYNNNKNAPSRTNKRGKKDGGGRTGQQKKRRDKSTSPGSSSGLNISFAALDWELDDPGFLKESVGITTSSSTPDDDEDNNTNKEEDEQREEAEEEEEEDKGFDLLLSCDCVYNDALVTPFVRTCADICRLRPPYRPHHPDESESNGRAAKSNKNKPPTICIVAQQQRVPDVFEAWLKEALKEFWVWRVRDEVLGDGLKGGTGYVVHLLLLRDSSV